MPIYEYICSDCSHQFDVMQKMSDAPTTICPSCQKSNVTRLVSAAGFQLKGSGWYETDFKTKPKPEKTTESKTETNKTAPSETKTNASPSTDS